MKVFFVTLSLSILFPFGTSNVNITVWNTFQDARVTEGIETIYDSDGPVSITRATEFPDFPTNYQFDDYGFYNIDVGFNFIAFTLLNNTGVTNVVFPCGTFDRYYFEFSEPVAAADIVEQITGISSQVELLPPGYELDFDDLFLLDIDVPDVLENGGILVEIVPGANLTQLGQNILLTYTLQSDVEVAVWNTFEDVHVTGGEEVICDMEGPLQIMPGPEFDSFPTNFLSDEHASYEINVGNHYIEFTLLNNTGATNFAFPKGTYDRFYFEFGQAVTTAKLIFSNQISSTVEVLPPGYKVDFEDLFHFGIPVPDELVNGGILVQINPGTILTKFGQIILLSYSLASPGFPVYSFLNKGKVNQKNGSHHNREEKVHDNQREGGHHNIRKGHHNNGNKVDHDVELVSKYLPLPADPGDVTVWNTFEDAHVTGGEETIYDRDGPVPITPEFEFVDFPLNFGSDEYGFYAIDVSFHDITFVLINNTGATNVVFPCGTFDRYYFEFSEPIASAEIIEELTEISSTVKVLPPGYSLDFENLFHFNIPVPDTLDNGGILVQVIPGANLTELGQNIRVRYRLESDAEVAVWNTFQNDTAEEEIIYDMEGPVQIMPGVTFDNFPENFGSHGCYDINVGNYIIIFTLVNNTGATDAVLPEGTFDRYYFEFSQVVSSAELLENFTDISSTVEVLPPGYILDFEELSHFYVPVPNELVNGGIRVQVVPGADLTELGQHIVVNYRLKRPSIPMEMEIEKNGQGTYKHKRKGHHHNDKKWHQHNKRKRGHNQQTD